MPRERAKRESSRHHRTKRYAILEEVSESEKSTAESLEDTTTTCQRGGRKTCSCKKCNRYTRSGRMVVISGSPNANVPAADSEMTTEASESAAVQNCRQQIEKQARCLRKHEKTAHGAHTKNGGHHHSSRKNRSQEKLKSVNPCCPLCTKPFQCPILLSCAHTFCKDCVTVFVETSDGKEFPCPVCSTRISLKGADEELFCPNFVILKMIESDEPEDRSCTVCDRDHLAKYLCEHCQDLLCSECKERHKVLKTTNDHTLKRLSPDMDVSNAVKKRYFCTEHKKEQLLLHCVQCQQSVCRECAILHHHGDKHNCVPIADAAKLYRELLQRKLYSLKSRSPGLQLSLMDVKRIKKLLKEQVKIVREEISESVKRLITFLKDRERVLYQNVNQAYKTRTNRLKEQREEILIELEQFEVASRVIQQLEQHDNNIEMLQMKATIDRTLKSLEKPVNLFHVGEDTILLKSNEKSIRESIERHGEIVQFADDKIANDQIIASDFEETGSSVTGSDRGNEKNTPRTRALTNWKLLKGRVADVVRYGKESQLQNGYHLDKYEDIPATCPGNGDYMMQESKAEINEPRNKKSPAAVVESKPTVKNITENCLENKSMTSDTKKAQKPVAVLSPRERYALAVSERARANWLLVKSKIHEVVSYGHATGGLDFQKITFSRRPRKSRTVLKLRHFRAKTLRARANWKILSVKMEDPCSLQKAARPLNVASVVEDYCPSSSRKQNTLKPSSKWRIVTARLRDVVLYGQYQKFNLGKTENQKEAINHAGMNSRGSKPEKSLTNCKKMKESLLLKKVNSCETLTHKDETALTLNRSQSINNLTNDSLDNWNRLIKSIPLDSPPHDFRSELKSFLKEKEQELKESKQSVKPPSGKSKIPRPKNNLSDVERTPRKSNLDKSQSNGNIPASLKHWDKLIHSHIPLRTDRLGSKRNSLVKKTGSAPDLSIDATDNARTVTPKGRKSEIRKSNEKTLKHWRDLSEGKIRPADANDAEALKKWQILLKAMSKTQNEDERMKYWEALLDGKILPNVPSVPNVPSDSNTAKRSANDAHWDEIANSTAADDTQAFLYWEKLIEGKVVKDPPLEAAAAVDGKTAKVKNESSKLVKNSPSPAISQSSGKSKRSVFKSIKAKMVSRTNSMKSNNSASKLDVSMGESILHADAKTFSLMVRDSGTNRKEALEHEVHVRVTSPDKSILSAHVGENADGTFTLFCCPRVDADFNMFVSLHGDAFSREHQVVNIYGTLAPLKKREKELACKTVSLIRWHLTPGLMKMSGDKVVANKNSTDC